MREYQGHSLGSLYGDEGSACYDILAELVDVHEEGLRILQLSKFQRPEAQFGAVVIDQAEELGIWSLGDDQGKLFRLVGVHNIV
jgi:hypothetical protein